MKAPKKKLILTGKFTVNENNFFYRPYSNQSGILAHRTKITGRWKTDRNHNLVFVVDESQNKVFGNTIKFATKIEKASSESRDGKE